MNRIRSDLCFVGYIQYVYFIADPWKLNSGVQKPLL